MSKRNDYLFKLKTDAWLSDAEKTLLVDEYNEIEMENIRLKEKYHKLKHTHDLLYDEFLDIEFDKEWFEKRSIRLEEEVGRLFSFLDSKGYTVQDYTDFLKEDNEG